MHKKIDSDNWRDFIKLDVSEEQKPFIQSNLHTIAESNFERGITLLGIYNDNVMVGFASYILDEEEDMKLYKFMIDKHYQGKGYGKEGLSLIMNILRNETRKNEV